MAEEDHSNMTPKFFELLRTYLENPHASLDDCGKELGQSKNTFLARMREAYKRGYLRLQGRDHPTLGGDIRDLWKLRYDWDGRAFVARDTPDDEMFARWAAENIIQPIRKALIADKNADTNIGIVSGSSVGQTIEYLVQSGVWDSTMSAVKDLKKNINVMALSVTPLAGWELEGNANIAVLRLAVLLQEKLSGCKVTPLGLGSTLVIAKSELQDHDKKAPNKQVVQLADPGRLDPSCSSKLDLVFTGLGSLENSVFQQVVEIEGIQYSEDAKPVDQLPEQSRPVGDIGFLPVNADGEEVKLWRRRPSAVGVTADDSPHGGHGKGGATVGSGKVARRNARLEPPGGSDLEECVIYGAIGLKTLRHLVVKRKQVVLIARNHRRWNRAATCVNKTAAIVAAVRGHYVSDIITDEDTAGAIQKYENSGGSQPKS